MRDGAIGAGGFEMPSRTDAELNLWIAKFLEPNPKRRAKQPHESMTQRGSKLGCWTFAFQCEDKQPRDFCNDPACTVMLMEKLLADFHIITLSVNFADSDRGMCVGQDETIRWGRTLGRAVAEAFALANGLEEK